MISEVKLANLVVGELKASFSIPITTSCSGDITPSPGLFHFSRDSYLIRLSLKQRVIK